MKCINCNSYQLSLSEKRRLAYKHRSQLNPTLFVCPKCGFNQCSTESSLLLRILELTFVVIVSIVVIGEVSKYFDSKFKDALFLVILCIQFLNFRYLCPNIIKLKPYQTLQEALPKSRAEGYFYFLILPIFIIFSLFALGIHFAG